MGKGEIPVRTGLVLFVVNIPAPSYAMGLAPPLACSQMTPGIESWNLCMCVCLCLYDFVSWAVYGAEHHPVSCSRPKDVLFHVGRCSDKGFAFAENK